jgi:hypothetical protein
VTAQTVKEVLGQRLIRGTRVTVADSFGKADLRGAEMIVASKGPVKCNGKGRCAGDWCEGLAVFLADPETLNEDKEMGWRGGTVKVCLTHLKDSDGHLVLAPPALQIAQAALAPRPAAAAPAAPAQELPTHEGVVTWEDLANADADRDYRLMVFLARKLKRESEELKTKVISLQEKLIATLR